MENIYDRIIDAVNAHVVVQCADALCEPLCTGISVLRRIFSAQVGSYQELAHNFLVGLRCKVCILNHLAKCGQGFLIV